MDWKPIIVKCVEVIRTFRARDVKPTIRTIFYALVSVNMIPNTLGAYKGLDKHLVEARKNGKIRFGDIADETRDTRGGDELYREPEEYAKNIVEYVKHSWDYYELPRWFRQPHYVEVWIEKFALAQTFQSWLKDMKVIIAPSRGYSSWTFLAKTAARIMRVKEGDSGIEPPSKRLTYELDFHIIDFSHSEEKQLLYGYHFNKNIGDNLGEASPADNVEEMLTNLKRIIKLWARYDSILGRYVESPNEKNTEITIHEGVPLTRGQVLLAIQETTKGQKGLSAFF